MNISGAKFNKKLPKNRFHFAMPEVETIVWLYKIAKSTADILDSEDAKELQIFEVKYKDGKVTTKYFVKIQSAIPYPILFLYGKNRFAMVIDGKLLTTDKELLTGDNLNVSALDIRTLIEKLAETMITMPRREAETIEELAYRQSEIDRLNKEIAALQRLIDTEKQPNRRFELNDEIREKMREMERVIK